MKTTLRYLLMVVAMVSFLSVRAQGLAQQPEAQMNSTSVMVGTGSTLPQAAIDGVSTTNQQIQDASNPSKHVRKGRPGDWTDPYIPIGDATWPLLMLAAVYSLLRVYKRKRE